MTSKTVNGLSIWAISSTAVALVLAGILIGQQLQSPLEEPLKAEAATEPGSVPAVDPYAVPNWLIDAPLEWRSEVTDKAEGIAILLDYHRRELLVEQCAHPGFFDPVKNLPRDNQGLVCQRLLTSSIMSFTADGADVKTRSGEDLFVGLSAVMENDRGKLDLELNGMRVRLVPGQTNDLNRAIVRVPSMAQEREALAQYRSQQLLQQRAHMTSATEGKIPTFSLPSPEVQEQHQRQRESDASTERALASAE